jgi:tRNA G18 (ribose-2'-O)-methylase SpoU
MKLNAKELRVTKPTEEDLVKISRKPLYIVLDNVLDTYNIGSIFRLADAVAAREVILCGGSEKPPSSRIHKAAVGTEEWVGWRYFATTQDALKTLKMENPNIKIIVVEQDARSVSLTSPLVPLLNSGEGNLKDVVSIALVVGHETDGCSKEVLDTADVIVEIPMWGVNKSLNVHVSAAVAVYKILENWDGL